MNQSHGEAPESGALILYFIWVIVLLTTANACVQIWDQGLHQIRTELAWALRDHDPLVWIRKLLLNQKEQNSPEGVLRTFGFVHLYTASGMHIYGFLVFLDSCTERFATKTHQSARFRKWIWFFGLGILFWAWALQGFRIGFLRPLLAFGFRQFALKEGVRFARFGVIAILFGLDLFFGEFIQIRGAGLFASTHYYLAILGGIFGMQLYRRQHKKSLWLEHLYLSVCSWLLTAAYDLVVIKQIALWTGLISLVTIPVLSSFLYPVLVLSSIWSIDVLCGISTWGNAIFEYLFFAVHDFKGLIFVSQIGVGVGFVFSGAFLFLRQNSLRFMLVFFVLLIAVSFRVSGFKMLNPIAISQLNVGQGDSLWIQKNARNEFYDSGKFWAKRDSDWLQFFSKNEILNIDAALISHWDEDHAGGLRQWARLISIHCVQTHPDAWKDSAAKAWHKWRQDYPRLRWESEAGSCFQSGFVYSFQDQKRKKMGNHRMLGIEIPLAENLVFVSLGDGTKSMERKWFADRFPFVKNKSIIWKVNHHGSNTSTDGKILQKLKIREFWISVGRRNFYKHPTSEVMDALGKIKAPIFRTDLNQNLNWSSDRKAFLLRP